jgi:hypothetical protein
MSLAVLPLPPSDEVADVHSDVSRDHAKQGRGDVSTRVKRHRCSPPVRMTVLAMGSALSNLGKTETFEDPGNLARLENRDITHLCDLDGLRAHKFSLELGFPILEKHRYDLFEVLPQFVDAGAL